MVLAADGHRARRLPLSGGWVVEVGEGDRFVVEVIGPGVNATARGQDSAVWQQCGSEFGSSVVVRNDRGMVISPTVVHWPVEGSYVSDPPMVVTQTSAHGARSMLPPLTSTVPFRRRTAECCWRPWFMLPVTVHVPVAGS